MAAKAAVPAKVAAQAKVAVPENLAAPAKQQWHSDSNATAVVAAAAPVQAPALDVLFSWSVIPT